MMEFLFLGELSLLRGPQYGTKKKSVSVICNCSRHTEK